MKVHEILRLLSNGAMVEIVDEYGNLLKIGTSFDLWYSLDNIYKNADVHMVSVHGGVVKLHIDRLVVTNFDKLKELYPNIKREHSTFDNDCDVIKGLDVSTKFRNKWLDAKYTGEDNE